MRNALARLGRARCNSKFAGVLSGTLARAERIEVRGFGPFSVRHRRPGFGHNPKTRAPIALRGGYLPHFKPWDPVVHARESLSDCRKRLLTRRRSSSGADTSQSGRTRWLLRDAVIVSCKPPV
ncbi:MAG TPA: HU family DNA-binding protein [Rudaea sp.]|jgi:nucleoid DNA-binding protein